MENQPTTALAKPQTHLEYMEAVNERIARENADQEAVAKPVLDALKAIPEIPGIGRDPAGYARRGGSVYMEVLHGRFTHEQLDAAHHCLMRTGADNQIRLEVELNDTPACRLATQ